MLLVDVKKCGKYKFKSVHDENLKIRLRQFGFVEQAGFCVLKINKGDFVCRVMGSMYAINSALAGEIEVEQLDE